MEYNIGEKIKELRTRMRISQSDLCGNFISRTILSRIENNKMFPSIVELDYIAKKFNVPVSYFFYNDKDMDLAKNNLINDIKQINDMYKNGCYCDIIELLKSVHENFLNSEYIILYYYKGMSYYNMKSFDKASKILKEFIKQYIESSESIQCNYIIELATSLNTLFKILLPKAKYKDGKEYLLLACKYLYKYGKHDSLISFIIHSNLGYIYNEVCLYKENVLMLSKFLGSINNLSYLNIMPDIYISLNIAYYNLEQYEQSIEHIKKSIFFYSYIGDKRRSIICYLNYINALRYSKNLKDAFDILEFAKKECTDDNYLSNVFLVQEAILHFNKEDYESTSKTIKAIDIEKLKKQSISNIYFMKGHIEFLKGDINLSKEFLTGIEEYFISKAFTRDLTLLYEDLYSITKDSKYLKQYNCYKQIKGRKNILI